VERTSNRVTGIEKREAQQQKWEKKQKGQKDEVKGK
jgi:hypothetical protein